MTGEHFYPVIKALVLPPGLFIVFLIVGIVLSRQARRAGAVVLWSVLLLLWSMSTPWIAERLALTVERSMFPYAALQVPASAQAIVVLGGGRETDAPEFQTDTVSRLTLERLRYAARLQRQSGLGLAVTGGAVGGEGRPEGDLMREALERDFRVPVRWVESVSQNTRENARLTAGVLDVRRIVLVTHALHMPRAMREFHAAGFDVTPAPLGFFSRINSPRSEFRDYLPSMKALEQSRYVAYEWLGALWYRLSAGLSARPEPAR